MAYLDGRLSWCSCTCKVGPAEVADHPTVGCVAGGDERLDVVKMVRRMDGWRMVKMVVAGHDG